MTRIRERSGRTVATIAAIALGLAAAGARAEIYVLVEQDGRVRFTNVPDDPRYRLYHRQPKARAAAVANVGHRPRSPLAGKALPEALANPRLSRRPFQQHVVAAARQTNLDPALIHAVIAAESNYDPDAVSPKGAVGLMQLLPDTARRYGVTKREIRQPAKNILAGAQYLADLLARFDGDVALALAGYNAGENSVARYGGRLPPYPETLAYVPRVLRVYDDLRLR